MTSLVKITQLSNIATSDITSGALLPVVNMVGVPITQKTTLGNLGNIILSQAGGNYSPAGLANLSYSVVNAAQPNITSVGTLTSLIVSGNTNLGNVGNVRITGGASGEFLTTDGTGNLSWASASANAYGNSNVVSLLAAFGSNTILTTGNITAGKIFGNGAAISSITGANVTGTVANAAHAINADAAIVAGTVTTATQSNITSVGTLTSLSVSGNANVGNIQSTNGIFTNVSGNGSQLTYILGANIVGEVSYAATANSVAVGNVAGIGNIASLNLDGSSSNVLYGNGVFDSVLSQLTPYSQTLVVDPNGSDITGDGSVNAPFASIQKAHDYAANNVSSTSYVVIQLNAGNYAGNITLSRPKTAIVGVSDGVIRSSWISGSVTVNLTSGSPTVSENIFALENLIVASSSNVITIGGNTRLVFFARNVYGYTSNATARVLDVTNTSSGGIKVDLFNTFLQSDGGGIVLATTNTYYLNMNYCTLAANSGPALSTTTTSGFVTTSRITTQTASNVVINVSQFAPGTVMNFGVCTFESTAVNGNGLYLTAGSTTALGGCAFNVPTGTGFAVAGAAGSVLVKSVNNNQIAYNTNGATQGTVIVLPMNYL